MIIRDSNSGDASGSAGYRSRCRQCLPRQTLRILFAAIPLLISGLAACAGFPASPDSNEAYYGNYRIAEDHLIGIDRFIMDSGEDAVLFSDYRSGVVRRLFPLSPSEFVAGPSLASRDPVEFTVRFSRDTSGATTRLSIQPIEDNASFATRVPLVTEEVVIASGRAHLAGTLMKPAAAGPHPAIVLLHGSGPLSRYSFGPYPHFFTSLGFAVLIFDKRGTGASTGTRLDASTGAQAPTLVGHYPDGLVDDALAAFDFLQHRDDINPKEIGFWGSSEGGMLATQVAARNKDVAFAINSSGFMGPLWQTILYQAGTIPRSRGLSAAEVEEAQEFARLWMKVARTGEDYDLFISKRDEARRAKKNWLFSYFSGEYTSLEQMRWDWDHILAFDPLPALESVSCPVLGVFGELDELTDVADAASNMRAVSSRSGNDELTVSVFRNAGHSLMETPSRSRMAPGVFETLRSWLINRVHVAAPQDSQ